MSDNTDQGNAPRSVDGSPVHQGETEVPGAEDNGSDTVVDEDLAKARKLPPVEGAELQAGQVLGKCRIEKELGRGGMGAVYLGRHTTLDVPVAIKVLPPEIAQRHEQFAQRFMREARLAAKIQHANIMGVLDADHDEATGLYYIVLEYVDGGSVRDLMDKGPLSEIKTVDIGISVAQALMQADEFNVIHRDIKPDNIMLTKKGQVKLADMGIAKQRGEEDTNLTMTSSMMGTPAYISPEQAMDAKSADARADIYSLGASMYHMLIGAPPYEGETTYAVLTKLATAPIPDARTRRPDLTPEVADVIMRMMAKSKQDRPQSAKQLVEELTMVRSRIATSATAVQEGGEIKLLQATSTPMGTPTQGIVGTNVAPGIGAAPGTVAPPQPAPVQSTAVGPAPAAAGGMKMALAACIVIIGAIAIILALRTGEQPVRPSPPPGSSSGSPTTTTQANTGTPGGASQEQPGGIGQVDPAGPASPVVSAPKAPEKPKDDDLVAQAVAALEDLPADKVETGTAMLKKGQRVDWPSDSEVRLIGFGKSEEQARKAAYQTALTTMLDQVVEQDEATQKKDAINKIVSSADKYVVTESDFGSDEKDGKHYVAIGAAGRAARLGRDLHQAGIAVKDLYALVGQPSVGIDIPETVDSNEAGTKDKKARRAQQALENALLEKGVNVVDVTGVSKDKQREYCDVLITGSSEAILRGSAPLPGGTKKIHIYNVELTVSIQLSATKRKLPGKTFEFTPKGAAAAKAIGDFDKNQAAKKSLVACVKENVPTISKTLIDEWVKLSGEWDFWIGITDLEGGEDVLQVKDAISKVPGVKRAVPRYYRDNTQFFGLVYDGTSEGLKNTLIKEKKWKVREQRGTHLIFSVK